MHRGRRTCHSTLTIDNNKEPAWPQAKPQRPHKTSTEQTPASRLLCHTGHSSRQAEKAEKTRSNHAHPMLGFSSKHHAREETKSPHHAPVAVFHCCSQRSPLTSLITSSSHEALSSPPFILGHHDVVTHLANAPHTPAAARRGENSYDLETHETDFGGWIM